MLDELAPRDVVTMTPIDRMARSTFVNPARLPSAKWAVPMLAMTNTWVPATNVFEVHQIFTKNGKAALMPDVEFEARLHSLRSKVEPLEKLVHTWAARLPPPLRYHSGKEHHGFRYGRPHAEHFCLLKAVRAVSAANAAIELARSGYAQEICVLIRTLVECTTHIGFVLSARDDAGKLEPVAEKYVQDFFADFARNNSTDFKRAQVRQKTVHDRLGLELDRFAQQQDNYSRHQTGQAERHYSDVYLTFSNYVHAKYPETMDLYGGQPGHFHLRGMRGTPKDTENLEMIDAFITTLSIALAQLVTNFRLHNLVERDLILAEWFRSTLSDAG